MAADDKTLVVNVLAFVANVAVSVVTIFVLKASAQGAWDRRQACCGARNA